MPRLSPVNQARWARFRHNRRGYWSLWIFLIVFSLSLCAELIANDKPLLVRYEGQWYFPLVKNYSERDFGGPLATTADYQDPGYNGSLRIGAGCCGPPYALVPIPLILPPRSLSPPRLRRKTGWAPMRMAATFSPASCTAPAFLFYSA